MNVQPRIWRHFAKLAAGVGPISIRRPAAVREELPVRAAHLDELAREMLEAVAVGDHERQHLGIWGSSQITCI